MNRPDQCSKAVEKIQLSAALKLLFPRLDEDQIVRLTDAHMRLRVLRKPGGVKVAFAQLHTLIEQLTGHSYDRPARPGNGTSGGILMGIDIQDGTDLRGNPSLAKVRQEATNCPASIVGCNYERPGCATDCPLKFVAGPSAAPEQMPKGWGIPPTYGSKRARFELHEGGLGDTPEKATGL